MVEPIGGDFPLVVIVGPTAAGKSALALELAERLGGEIVSCDSVEVYRGFDVGTAKPSLEERRGIPHHLLDLVDAGAPFSAGDYMREARQALDVIRGRGKLPIVVGGTGFYLRALLLGLFRGPMRSETLRARLQQSARKRGRAHLHRMLARLDPEAARRIQPRDMQKVVRAIEVCLLSRQPLSRMQAQGRDELRGFRTLKIGLDPDRADLFRRINPRVERMFAQGLLEETREAVRRAAHGPAGEKTTPLDALGYRQAWALLRGEMTLPEAIAETQQATRRYAKRQWTWFRRERGVVWFRGFGDDPQTQMQIFGWLQSELSTASGEAGSASPIGLSKGESK